MTKTYIKLIISFLTIIIFFLIYLTLFGIETKRFNNHIISSIKNIDKNLGIELNEVQIILDPINFKINASTENPTLYLNNKEILKIKDIKTKISLKALLNKKFSISNLKISTKRIQIDNFIYFVRLFNKSTELYLFQKFLKKGYLISDIKINFDEDGNILDNYKINGYIKDTKIDIFKTYNINNLNFNFALDKKELNLKELAFNFNNINFFSEKVDLYLKDNEYLIKGKVQNKILKLSSKQLIFFEKNYLSNFEINDAYLSSDNIFSLRFSKQFKLDEAKIRSNINLKKLSLKNNLNIKNFFPNAQDNIELTNHKITIDFDNNNNLFLKGKGDVLIQDKNDFFSYKIENQKKSIGFDITLILKENELFLNFINFEKNKDLKTTLKIKGKKEINKNLFINNFSLDEGENRINIQDLVFNQNNQIIKFKKAKFNYFDKEKKFNQFDINLKKNKYLLKGNYFNANYLIENLIKKSEKNKFSLFTSSLLISINLDKVFLDKIYDLSRFSGSFLYKNNEIIDASLIGYFTRDKKLSFTVKQHENEKITTLFLDEAEPLVKRYRFIKGFKNGSLDLNSIKKNKVSKSTLRIYNFKLRELPILTKLLTLASLQGIADILSGEGIRFDEFEMKYSNKDDLITIDEAFAIGPAISLLMKGYIEKDKLISLRGTLVPATTINKAIGSIPVLGEILVGSKTGEGVFGVSFKIKGPPKNLETSVNPIKTLTPRFITRTLEKIKK